MLRPRRSCRYFCFIIFQGHCWENAYGSVRLSVRGVAMGKEHVDKELTSHWDR